ncbi:transcription factor subunit TAF6 [Cryptosporidium felis]|nr:transcription factor subunit TAF6 [Cryptosporidium felis]
MSKEKSRNLEYSQLFLESSLNVGDFEVENNLLLRKKQKIDQSFNFQAFEGLENSKNTGILSAYDFVYPISKQFCCDLVSNEAAILIIQTVEFRLRQIIEEAIKMSFHRGSCNLEDTKNTRNLPYISFGDLNSVLRYLCGSPNVIWSSEKPFRSYFINSKHIVNKDLAITETDPTIFYNLPERSIKYIPCFSLSKDQISAISRTNRAINSSSNTISETFHTIVKELNSEFSDCPVVNLHWLAVDGKFVFSSENDTKFIKELYRDKIGSSYNSLIENKHNKDLLDDISTNNFKVVINKGIEGFLTEEQREFLSYMNRIFLSVMESSYLSHNLPYLTLNNYYNIGNRASVLIGILNTYGISEKDLNRVTSVISMLKGSAFGSETAGGNRRYGEMNNSSASENDYFKSKDFQTRLEMISKLTNIFDMIEMNADLEHILPYLVYYIFYNTRQICSQFESTGKLPKNGALRLLIRLSLSIIRNPYCSSTTYYIHKVIESLMKIMVSCPRKCVLSGDHSSISTFSLLDNLNSRLEASRLLEYIVKVCCHYLPLGGAQIIKRLSDSFQKMLDHRLSNLANSNSLQIASLFGIVCGIRSLDDYQVSSIALTKLLTILSFYPEEYNSRVSFIQLHIEISALLNKYFYILSEKLDSIEIRKSDNIIILFWRKLIESIENILGDGVIPIILGNGFCSNDELSDKVHNSICFLENCIETNRIDSIIACPNSQPRKYYFEKKHLSSIFIKGFIDSRNTTKCSKAGFFCNEHQEFDLAGVKSMLKITI